MCSGDKSKVSKKKTKLQCGSSFRSVVLKLVEGETRQKA